MGWAAGSKGWGGKGKDSWGKGGGTWAWIPDVAPVQSSWKSGKSFGKGKKGGKGKGKGKKGERTPFSELPEEKKEEIRAKHEARNSEEGREAVDDNTYAG